MHLIIYFDAKPLFIADSPDAELLQWRQDQHTAFYDRLSTEAVRNLIAQMQQPGIKAGIFLHPDLDALKKMLWAQFTVIQAGGGLVSNARGELLMIFRRGKWDLPKGKWDEGETIADCALREVREETGLSDIILGDHLLTTYHTYHQGQDFILKESHWYRMQLQHNQPLVPQTEEDIAEARWVTKDMLPELMENTFPSVKDVLRMA